MLGRVEQQTGQGQELSYTVCRDRLKSGLLCLRLISEVMTGISDQGHEEDGPRAGAASLLKMGCHQCEGAQSFSWMGIRESSHNQLLAILPRVEDQTTTPLE